MGQDVSFSQVYSAPFTLVLRLPVLQVAEAYFELQGISGPDLEVHSGQLQHRMTNT